MKKTCEIILFVLAIGVMGTACSGIFPKQKSRPSFETETLYEPKTANPPQTAESAVMSDKKPRRIGEVTSAKPAPHIRKPAVAQLIRETREQMEKGQYKSAFATAERGVAIDSSDALLWSLMAEIRLKLNNSVQAELLAKKSNLLAKGDKSIQAKNWRIIAEALRRKGANKEAEHAFTRAVRLEKEIGTGG